MHRHQDFFIAYDLLTQEVYADETSFTRDEIILLFKKNIIKVLYKL